MLHTQINFLLAFSCIIGPTIAVSVARQRDLDGKIDLLQARIQQNQFKPRNRSGIFRPTRPRALVPRASALCGPNKCPLGKICRDLDGICIERCTEVAFQNYVQGGCTCPANKFRTSDGTSCVDKCDPSNHNLVQTDSGCQCTGYLSPGINICVDACAKIDKGFLQNPLHGGCDCPGGFVNALGLCVNVCATVNLGFLQAELGGCKPCPYVNSLGQCKPACTKLDLGYLQNETGGCSCRGIEVAGKCVEACPAVQLAQGFTQNSQGGCKCEGANEVVGSKCVPKCDTSKNYCRLPNGTCGCRDDQIANSQGSCITKCTNPFAKQSNAGGCQDTCSNNGFRNPFLKICVELCANIHLAQNPLGGCLEAKLLLGQICTLSGTPCLVGSCRSGMGGLKCRL